MTDNYLKEKLSNLRLYLTIISAMGTASFAWFIANNAKTSIILSYYAMFLIVALTAGLILIVNEIQITLRRLKNYE